MAPGFAIEGRSGGVGQFVVALGRALDRARVEPILCGLWSYGTPAEAQRVESLRADGITVLIGAEWRPRHTFVNVAAAFRGLRDRVIELKPDIIHSHSESADPAALLLKRACRGARVMRTLHGTECASWPRIRPWARWLYPLFFDREIAISASVQAELDSRSVARWRQVHAGQINNGIDLERFANLPPVDRASVRRRLGLPSDGPLVGSVGRLARPKGYDLLLEAFRDTSGELKGARLVLIGTGEAEDELRALAARLELGSRVVFAGPRSDVPDLIRALDLFVLPSRWEGLSTVLMEAMVCGVPVVGTDIPGIRDLIHPDVSGWLVPPEDALALRRAISRALADPVGRVRVAERARDDVRAFDIGAVARRYEEEYRELVDRSARSA